MSNYSKNRYSDNYMEKEQVFWKVFGCGPDVKLATVALPAGTPYETRLAALKSIDNHVKHLGGKVLKSGFWTTPQIPSDVPSEPLSVEVDDGLPF